MSTGNGRHAGCFTGTVSMLRQIESPFAGSILRPARPNVDNDRSSCTHSEHKIDISTKYSLSARLTH